MDHGRDRPSWAFTLLTQIAFCFALYMAFYYGSPQRSNNNTRRGVDLYFLSVKGGQRPSKRQTQLLKQMDKVAKIHKVKFVVDISELGEDDPLYQNGTLHFASLKVPWYTTRTSQGQTKGYFSKQIALPLGQTLDIIGVDTGPFHDSLHVEQPSETDSDQLHWLMRTLSATDSKWRVVVGYHPLIVCAEEKYEAEETKFYKPLHHIFLQYGVNAYLSKQSCVGHYTSNGGIAYIGNPGHMDEYQRTSVNGSSSFIGEMHNGFLLHRVSPLEIVSYYINSAREVVFKSRLHQCGKEVM